jgi:hypothetical protein
MLQKSNFFLRPIEKRHGKISRTDGQGHARYASTGAEIEHVSAIRHGLPPQKISRLDDEHVDYLLCVAQPCEVDAAAPMLQKLDVLDETIELESGEDNAALLTLLAEAMSVILVHAGPVVLGASENRP